MAKVYKIRSKRKRVIRTEKQLMSGIVKNFVLLQKMNKESLVDFLFSYILVLLTTKNTDFNQDKLEKLSRRIIVLLRGVARENSKPFFDVYKQFVEETHFESGIKLEAIKTIIKSIFREYDKEFK